MAVLVKGAKGEKGEEDILVLCGGNIELKDLEDKMPEQYSFKGLLEISSKGQNLNSFGEFSTTELGKVAGLAAKIHKNGRMITSLLFENQSSQLNIISDDGREMIIFFYLGRNTVIITCEKA